MTRVGKCRRAFAVVSGGPHVNRGWQVVHGGHNDFTMPYFKANQGNLLQHWVLCELVEAAMGHAGSLAFIDAYSMAPMASEKPDTTPNIFHSVRRSLHNQRSPYEVAWSALQDGESGYPNSAALLDHIWPGSCAMILCEKDPATINELRSWQGERQVASNHRKIEVWAGDWRERFAANFALQADLALVSFDPNMISSRRPRPNPENMYSDALDLIGQTLAGVSTPTLIQLSTYTANGGNKQSDVERLVDASLGAHGFSRVASACAGRHMMSLVYARNVEWASELASIELRFATWLSAAKADR